MLSLPQKQLGEPGVCARALPRHNMGSFSQCLPLELYHLYYEAYLIHMDMFPEVEFHRSAVTMAIFNAHVAFSFLS